MVFSAVTFRGRFVPGDACKDVRTGTSPLFWYNPFPSGRPGWGIAKMVLLSHRMYLWINFRESTPPKNRQLIVYNQQLQY